MTRELHVLLILCVGVTGQNQEVVLSLLLMSYRVEPRHMAMFSFKRG